MSSDSGASEYMISSEYPGVEYFEDEVREGFFVSSMMKRYWAAQIKVLAEIDKICRKYGIRWFADCGTLLGAVRHGGMIPWDDDMDICMLRKDWLRFFEVAQNELPEEYCVLSLRHETEYEDIIGRIVNAHAIDYRDEHMKEFFGCPYTVGVDIFPLDDMLDDDEVEENRRKFAAEVARACDLVKIGKEDSPECRNLLDKIERVDNTIFHRGGNLFHELRLLIEKIYMMHSSDDAPYVALMPHWVSWHSHKYSKALFKDMLYLPFEYIRIPVPARYEEVLRIEYGEFMTVYKGGGVHEYPVYGEQEEMLRVQNKGNPFRYTLTGQAIDSMSPRKTTEQKCYEITGLLLNVHEQVDSLEKAGNTDHVTQLLENCQTLAISLGTLIEKQMPDSGDLVHLLEDYCERVYSASGSWTDVSRSILDQSIKETEESVKGYFLNRKKEVLFIVTKAKWWDVLSPLYDHYVSKTDTEVHVLAVPYHISDRVAGFDGETRNDIDLLPPELMAVNSDGYDIPHRHPDVIVTGYPYDGWGTTIDVQAFHYSENLRSYTDELIYVPCFGDVDLPINEKDKALAAIKVMLEQPAVLYSDKIVVRSNEIRECYVRILTDISGHEKYWLDKIMAFDDLAEVEYCDETDLPVDWESVLSGRKLLLFGVNGAFLIENGQKAINKLKESIEMINEASDNIFCIFTPSEDVEGIKNIDSELWQEYKRFTDSLTGSRDVMIDWNHEAENHLGSVTAYYGTPGELAHRCRNLRKPVMLMKIL